MRVSTRSPALVVRINSRLPCVVRSHRVVRSEVRQPKSTLSPALALNQLRAGRIGDAIPAKLGGNNAATATK